MAEAISTTPAEGRRPEPNGCCLRLAEITAPTARICIRGYECWHCAFDQWLEDWPASDNRH